MAIRKRRRSARDSRAALFRAAALEFSERGYDAAGTDRIAARARLNKAMLYYHFGSKRELYLEVVREMVGAEDKLDRWIAAIVEEAAARPWFPPMMLRELAAGAPHFDAHTFSQMNAVFEAVRDIITQGQREGLFRDADPLLSHLTIMPPILIFFVRERVMASSSIAKGLAQPRSLDQFVHHMQASVRGMLRKTPS
jgi:AcrR family transcriptional regulator